MKTKQQAYYIGHVFPQLFNKKSYVEKWETTEEYRKDMWVFWWKDCWYLCSAETLKFI